MAPTTQEVLREYARVMDRHAVARVGAELFFYDRHCSKYRKGVVQHIHRYYGTTYLVLEVDVGPPIGDFYLHMVSHRNVRTRGQLEDYEILEDYLETSATLEDKTKGEEI